MPARGWLLCISDILDAIAAIEGFTEAMDYATFARDRRTIDAVLHNLMANVSLSSMTDIFTDHLSTDTITERYQVMLNEY